MVAWVSEATNLHRHPVSSYCPSCCVGKDGRALHRLNTLHSNMSELHAGMSGGQPKGVQSGIQPAGAAEAASGNGAAAAAAAEVDDDDENYEVGGLSFPAAFICFCMHACNSKGTLRKERRRSD